jgi:hypothetical protein
MSLERPQKNVPLTEGGEMMNVQTYALLQGFYEALTEPKTSIRMQSPDGNLWDLSISNAGAVVVTAA